MARKACRLQHCKIQPDVVQHPGTFGILHFTYYVLGQIKSFSGILNSKVVWVLLRRVNQFTFSHPGVCKMLFSINIVMMLWKEVQACKECGRKNGRALLDMRAALTFLFLKFTSEIEICMSLLFYYLESCYRCSLSGVKPVKTNPRLQCLF